MYLMTANEECTVVLNLAQQDTRYVCDNTAVRASLRMCMDLLRPL